MSHPLDQLVEDGIIQEVVARLKSGKEADIYLVQHAGEIVAAKLYKERHVRNFKNNAAYKEGRVVRNSRTQRAIDRGSRFGQEAAEEEWKAKESDTLHKLFAAQVRVPHPVLFYEGVLLMEAVIDPEGHPAPRLIDAPIPRERAADLYADIRQQMIKMLMCDLIHGDLSPYNVLLAWNGPTIIDFPQVVDASHNRQAAFFFDRDLQTIRRFFAGFDPSLHAREGDAHEIWRAYERRDLTPDFVPPIRPVPAGGARGLRRGPAGDGTGRGPRRGPPGGGEERGPRRGPSPMVETRGQGRGPAAGADARGPGRGQPPGADARAPGRGPPPGADARGPGRGPPPGADARSQGRGPPPGADARSQGRGPPPGGDTRGQGRGPPPGADARGHGRGPHGGADARGQERGPADSDRRGTRPGSPSSVDARGTGRGPPPGPDAHPRAEPGGRGPQQHPGAQPRDRTERHAAGRSAGPQVSYRGATASESAPSHPGSSGATHLQPANGTSGSGAQLRGRSTDQTTLPPVAGTHTPTTGGDAQRRKKRRGRRGRGRGGGGGTGGAGGGSPPGE